MANKNSKSIELEAKPSPIEPKKNKKGKQLLVFVVILAVVGIVGFVFRKQLGQFLAANLKNVPIVGSVFKEESDPYLNITKEQLIQELEVKKTEQTNLDQRIKSLQEQNEILEQRITDLKEYEVKHEDFLNQKEAWDKEVAKTNPNMFLEQFEKMYPETMEKIYKDIKIDTQITKAQKQFATTIAQMEPEQAARALEILIPTDPELIKLIFASMEQERKSLILNNMLSSNAATVIKLLSPDVTLTNE
ncbi:hypothetical protein [Cellulosilyticum sp. I15G10I2]|uniref:hypothetical protein n=1 Tax=Cellulosilyticum sp. I15G10I2 TaxID=1892843 RepID=UPI00085C3C91|nr:hypothetical protein [Cellulosilyticum sp. I15G10I2]